MAESRVTSIAASSWRPSPPNGAVTGLAPLPATLRFQLSFAPVVMERLLQFPGEWPIKNLRADPTQRFVEPRIRLGQGLGEPAFCRFPRSLPQSGAPLSASLAIVRTVAGQSPLRRRPLGILIIWLWRPAGLPHATGRFLNWRGW
jgi:hypothetical protein